MRILQDTFSKTEFADKLNDLLTDLDIPDNNEETVNIINCASLSGDFEFIQNKILNNRFLEGVNSFEAEEVTFFNLHDFVINANLVHFLRNAKSGKLILVNKGVKEFMDSVLKRKAEIDEKEKEREDIVNLEKELKELKKELKELKKDVTDSRLYKSMLSELTLAKEAFRNRRVRNSFLTELNPNRIMLLKGFDIEFFDENVIVATVRKTLKQSVATEPSLLELVRIIDSSKEKNLTMEDKAKFVWSEFKGSEVKNLTFEEIKLSDNLFLMNFLEEIPEINLDEDISLQEVSPVTEMKPHIQASVMVSGMMGDIKEKISVNGEDYFMKSIMIPNSKTIEKKENGRKITETTLNWVPVVGIYNTLRKEVSVLLD